jgi:hypothetical protein
MLCTLHSSLLQKEKSMIMYFLSRRIVITCYPGTFSADKHKTFIYSYKDAKEIFTHVLDI